MNRPRFKKKKKKAVQNIKMLHIMNKNNNNENKKGQYKLNWFKSFKFNIISIRFD